MSLKPLFVVAVLSAACARPPSPTVADLSIPRPCTGLSNLTAAWSDTLPIISDTSLQHVMGGGTALHYPDDLRRAYRSGTVRARFVIDTLGNVVRGSGIIEASSDEGLSQAVCQALPELRFVPVEVGGHKAVVGLVHVPFTFRVSY
jgi:TonB family protein